MRTTVVRLSASTTLAFALTLGAGAFLPPVFGCGTQGGADCRTSSEKTESAPAQIGILFQIHVFLDTAGLVLRP